jgi:hypothetical protein
MLQYAPLTITYFLLTMHIQMEKSPNEYLLNIAPYEQAIEL